MDNSTQLYSIMCLPEFSTLETVRASYKQLVLKYHPDKNLGDPTSIEKFRQVQVAYDILGNEEKKKKYDAQLKLQQTVGLRPGRNGNPYMPSNANSNFNASIYEEIRRQQEARQRGAGAAQTRSKSQYTKAQQDAFRKKEKERQAELKRQREQEKKDQRERERETLRREQEKQEELLQKQWQQQQQRNFNTPRTARGAKSANRSHTPQPQEGSPMRPSDLPGAFPRDTLRMNGSTPIRQRSATPRQGQPMRAHRSPPPSESDRAYRQGSQTSTTDDQESTIGATSSFSPSLSVNTYTTTSTTNNPIYRAPKVATVEPRSFNTPTKTGSHARASSGDRRNPLRSSSTGSHTPRGGSPSGGTASPRNKSLGRNSGTAPVRPGSASSPTNPPPLRSMVGGGMNLSNSDRETLERRRLEKLEKEKEKQRLQRKEEEEKHLQLMKRLRKKQERERLQKAEKDEADITWEQKLEYIQADETCEREQLIEREEALARKRIERTLAQNVDSVVAIKMKGIFNALEIKEQEERQQIQRQMQLSRDVLFCPFREGLNRRVLELKENKDRKTIAGLLATEGYYARRRNSHLLLLLQDEKTLRRAIETKFSEERAVLRLLQQESLFRLSLADKESNARYLQWKRYKADQAKQNVLQSNSSFHSSTGAETTSNPSPKRTSTNTSGIDTATLGNLSTRVRQYLSSSRNAQTPSSPLSASTKLQVDPKATLRLPLLQIAVEGEEEERLVLLREEERHFMSFLRQRANGMHMIYMAEREEAVRRATEDVQDELRLLRQELREVRRHSSVRPDGDKYAYDISSRSSRSPGSPTAPSTVDSSYVN